MSDAPPRLEPLGDRAVLIVLGDGIDDAVNARVHRLAAALERGPFGRPIPAYASLLVPVDPLAPGVDAAIDHLRAVVGQVDQGPAPDAGTGPVIQLPTFYGGPGGPDLDEVASLHDLRPADVIELHAGTVYRVHFLGFAPGFAYLGRVAQAIATPRLSTPRERVPAGSVAIAGQQTAVYPVASPGGWRVIGRTETRVWDAATHPPALLLPGRRVRFIPAGN
jgi:KipI family sensor histidine kinase inhibitor